MRERIPVLEIFGPTIQGEGMVIGQKTMFVRTAGCDFSCVWCDSAFTWDGSAKKDIRMMTGEEIFAQLMEIGGDNFRHVTISGGNPALLKSLNSLISLLKENGMRIGLETQGSKWQPWFECIDDLTISPKPPSSTMPFDEAMLQSIISQLREADRARHVSLKVVIFDEVDLEFAERVHMMFSDIPFYVQVGNDDTATLDDIALRNRMLDKLNWLVDRVCEKPSMNNVRVLPQLHALLWGNKRGV